MRDRSKPIEPMPDPAAVMWLDAAVRIGERIVAAAEWHNGSCTWPVWVPDQTRPPRGVRTEPARGLVYQGTAGIGLFLAELYRCTQDQRFLISAVGALQHALQTEADLPPWSSGFFCGRVGIAYASARLAAIANEPALLDKAVAMLEPLAEHSIHSPTLDVIGGAAGAIPALLCLADTLPAALTIDLAMMLGDQMIRGARRRHIGWSWAGGPSTMRDLNGFAHGASGFAYAFLTLYETTMDEWYRYAAEQAMLYERQYLNQRYGNWPDFRYQELSEYLTFGQTDELRRRLRVGGSLRPHQPAFLTAWCHGAPGICLTRLRALEIIACQTCLAEATIATATTLTAVQRDGDNYSLCHGYLGNCETLLAAARALGRPELREAAEARARNGIERYEDSRRPWPCGALGGNADASLLTGEAGIGYFFLRLFDCGTPPILALGVRVRDRAVKAPRNARDLQRDHVMAHFGTAIRAFDALQPDRPPVLEEVSEAIPSTGPSDVIRVHDTLVRRMANENVASRRALLEDAFAVDSACYALNRVIEGPSEEFLDSLTRIAAEDVEWTTATMQLADHVTVVETNHDWPRWPNGDRGRPDRLLGRTFIVVFRSDSEARTQKVSPFAAIVLSNAKTPGTVVEIARRVSKHTAAAAHEQLETLTLAQLKEAYVAGLVRIPQESLGGTFA